MHVEAPIACQALLAPPLLGPGHCSVTLKTASIKGLTLQISLLVGTCGLACLRKIGAQSKQ